MSSKHKYICSVLTALLFSQFTFGSNWKLLKKKCLNALTCRPPLTLNFVHIIKLTFDSSELYNVYNSRIAQRHLNFNVFKKDCCSKQDSYCKRKLNNFPPFWDLTYTPEWFEFIDVGLTFLALKNCIVIRKTNCCKFRQAYNTGLYNSQFAISFKPSCRSSKPFYSHGVPIFEISFGVFLFNLFKHVSNC